MITDGKFRGFYPTADDVTGLVDGSEKGMQLKTVLTVVVTASEDKQKT